MPVFNRLAVLILFTSFLLMGKICLAEDCHEVLTSVPPFYLSGVSENRQDRFSLGTAATVNVESRVSQEGDKPTADDLAFEKLHSDDAPQDADRFHSLGRGSVVRLVNPEDAASVSDPSDGEHLVQIEVRQVENRYSPHSAGEAAKVGEKGYIANTSLQAATDKMVFILKKDSYLALFPHLKEANVEEGSALKLLMQNGKYRALECEDKSLSYLFGQFDPVLGKFLHPVALQTGENACVEFSEISDVQFDSLLKVQKAVAHEYAKPETPLSHFVINDWGMVQIPMRKSTLAPGIVSEAPDRSFVKFKGAEAPDTSIWAEPAAVCGFIRIAKEWRKSCGPQDASARCTIQLGDAAFITPGIVTGSPLDPLGHKFHHSGRCFDIRPLRKDATFDRVNLDVNPADYDRDATQKLIQFLLGQGATPIYFNDPQTYGDPKLGSGPTACDYEDSFKDTGKKVMPCPGHSNHIHFCLDPERVKGC